MKAWRKTQAVFQEDEVEFTPSDYFTFIRYNKHTYMIPMGLTSYKAMENSNPKALASSMVAFDGNKYGVPYAELIDSSNASDKLVSQMLDLLYQGQDVTKLVITLADLEPLQDVLKQHNVELSDKMLAKFKQATTLSTDIVKVATITAKFIDHMLSAKMVDALIDPNTAGEVLRVYGKDPKHDKVF